MYEEHACKFYKAQTHCSCWIHLRWSRVLDTAGRRLFTLHPQPQISREFLQDGTFSFEDFATTFEEYDVQRVIRSYENSISIHVHCCEEGEWKQVRSQISQPGDSTKKIFS